MPPVQQEQQKYTGQQRSACQHVNTLPHRPTPQRTQKRHTLHKKQMPMKTPTFALTIRSIVATARPGGRDFAHPTTHRARAIVRARGQAGCARTGLGDAGQ